MKENQSMRVMHRAMHRVKHGAQHRAALAATLATCAVALASASVSAAAPAAPTTVDITKFVFGPKEITVAPGTTVRWVNHDEVPHTVAGSDKSQPFASKAMDTDDKFEVTFDKEGNFAYICTVHPFMTGVVHVRKP